VTETEASVNKFATITIPALAAGVLLAACGSSSSKSTTTETQSRPSGSSGGSSVTVKTASNAAVGGTVLVNAEGMTLYSLSAEQNGRFICSTSACEAVWHPLIATSGTPSGVESLGTVKRPNGAEQVTFKGMPLYTFAQDAKPGDAKGEGVKDVGTWNAVMATSSSGAASAPTTTTTTSSGGGYGY
jgi:predicted lipoprotein with Yx(FWY)xxD motif